MMIDVNCALRIDVAIAIINSPSPPQSSIINHQFPFPSPIINHQSSFINSPSPLPNHQSSFINSPFPQSSLLTCDILPLTITVICRGFASHAPLR